MRNERGLASAFPTLVGRGTFVDVLRSIGLEETDDVAGLLRHDSRPQVLDKAARLLIEFQPGVTLRESLPGMDGFQAEMISSGILSSRPYNALRRANKGQNQTWGDLSRLCPAALFMFTNLGMTSAIEIISTSALRALIAIDEGWLVGGSTAGLPDTTALLSAAADRSTPSGSAAAPAPPVWPAMRAWNVVLQWLQETTEAKTLSDALDELRRASPPNDVASAWEEIEGVRLDEIVSRPSADMMASFITRIDQRLGDERVRRIFWERIALAPPTLEQLGLQLDITRERVRQLQSRAYKEVRNLIEDEFVWVRWRAEALSLRLGTAFPTGAEWAADAISGAAVGILPDAVERFSLLLLWLAGPYSECSDGWTRAQELPRREVAHGAVSDGSVIDETALVELLTAQGLAPSAAFEWIAQRVPIRTVGEVKYLWEGSVADKALILLRAWREPATAEDITEAVGEGHGVRSTRTRLLEDERFKRVDRQRIGLREWEMDEYTGIADELAEEIERRGGSCELGDLVATVASNYDLRPASVEAYTGAPRFVLQNRVVRLRESDEPYVPRRTLTDEARCYLHEPSVCSYRLLVDREVLRGSGRPLPEGLGAWLGVLPGVRRVISFDGGDIPVTWPDGALLGPSIGSLRRVVDGLKVVPGNWIRLTFDRDLSTGTAAVVDPDVLLGLPAAEQVAQLTGIRADDAELESALGISVGASAGKGLRERLRRRGEDDLLNLIPNRSAELDEALDRIKDLF